mgnify:CR=1 FL=1
MVEKSTVLFDLDNTLFDHHYSVKKAISKQREPFGLGSFTASQLTDIYNSSLQVAYDRYLRKEISYEEKDLEKSEAFLSKFEPTSS